MDSKKLDSSRPSLWQNTDFLKLWFGQTISEFGSRITRDGLPLVAVITLSASPDQIGFLTMISALPVLLFALFIGAWVDRLPRRPLLIFADIGRLLVLLFIPITAVHGTLTMPMLYVVGAVMGILTLVFSVAYRALLPSTVRKDQLVEANSKLTTSEALAEVGAPSLAGVLIQVFTAPLAILFDALSYLFSISSIMLMHPQEAVKSTTNNQSLRREIVEGGQLILRSPILRTIALGTGLRAFFGSFIGTLYALWAIRDLGLTPSVLGLLIGVGGIGAILGASLAHRTVKHYGLGRTLTTALLIGGAVNFLIPLADGNGLFTIMMLGLSQIIGDAMMTAYFIHEVSLRQMITPEHVLGRVNASMDLIGEGIAPIGAVIAGGLATAFGTQAMLFVAVTGIMLTAIWMLFTPLRRITEIPTEQLY